MLTTRGVLDRYFLDTRCMLLEIAATLDRYDRAAELESGSSSAKDSRLEKIYQSLDFLSEQAKKPDRSERLLNLFSDPD